MQSLRLLTLGALAAFVLSCASPVIAQAPPNPSFDEVTGKLDKGGTLFAYVRIENMLNHILDQVEPILEASGDESARMFVPIGRAAVKALGLDQFNDLGLSYLPLGPDRGRVKKYLRLKSWSGVFRLLGGEPRDLAGLSMIPSDAVVATVHNLDFGQVLPLAEQAVESAAGAAGKSKMRAAILAVRKDAGVDIEKLLASLGDEWGAYLRIDESRKMTLKLGDSEELALPQVTGVLFIKTTNTAIYDTITSAARNAEKKFKETTVRRVRIAEPEVGENEFNLKPVIGAGNGWLYFATERAELEKALSKASGGEGLKNAAEFAALAKDIAPPKWNSATFVSPRLSKTVKQVWEQVADHVKAEDDRQVHFWKMLVESANREHGSLAVRVNEPSGVLWVAVGNVTMGDTLSAGATIAAAGVGVAVAVPAYLRGRENSRSRACQENLAKLDGAKEQFALEAKLESGAEVKMEDLVGPDKYLRKEPVCPSGGEYTLNKIGENPTCSIGDSNESGEPHVLNAD